MGHLRNVTVPEGRDVALVCTVKNLGAHKVSSSGHFDRKRFDQRTLSDLKQLTDVFLAYNKAPKLSMVGCAIFLSIGNRV